MVTVALIPLIESSCRFGNLLIEVCGDRNDCLIPFRRLDLPPLNSISPFYPQEERII